MENLHLVSANVLSPLIAALPFGESKVEAVLEVVGLAPTLIETQSGIVPLYAAERMLTESAKLVGDPTFGFDSLPVNASDMDGYMASLPLLPGSTGLEASFDLADKINGLLTGDRVFGTVRDGIFWIRRTTTGSKWTKDWAVVQYSLAIFLSGMRQLFGSNLVPHAVSIPTKTLPAGLPNDLRGIPLVREAQMAGMAFRIQDVCRVVKARRLQNIRGQTVSSTPLSSTDKSALAACTVEFMRSGTSDMMAHRMAASFGMSVRSYQRRLNDVGTTHSALIDSARLELALRLLAEEKNSVTEIAFELGYSYPGHFTRFFKRKVGLSPTEYRKIEVTS
ncbi:helix-turn-helix domain-containing protein [Roseobacter sp.]|uniref:AraC family transcriptional regulator n=1 Tax=Roseobacter sp. TaxID=1907202 RepID=UPI00385A6C95